MTKVQKSLAKTGALVALAAAAGLSIFWNTPIGPLRFDFSQALQKESYDLEQTFDMSLATTF